MTSHLVARGPYFEELARGQVFAAAPAVTLTSGMAASHRAVLGYRWRLALDDRLAADVTGQAPLAAPELVWDVAIGQSTVATQNVRANLFYRGLVFSRFPRIGDTLSTVTTVEGLRRNRPREGRPATGLAALRITTTDQQGRTVLDFVRCAMLPLGNPAAVSAGAAADDDLRSIGTPATDAALAGAVQGWHLDRMPRAGAVPDPAVGTEWTVAGGDVVSSAPELARLTLNVAAVHHDARTAGGRRLVYGGHTIGLASAQLTRALPDAVAIVGWHSCDHVGPVHEGETVRSVVTLERLERLGGSGGALAHVRVQVSVDQVSVDDEAGAADRPVLDWRPVVVLA